MIAACRAVMVDLEFVVVFTCAT